MSQVAGSYRIAEFERGESDQQIRQGDARACGRHLSIELSGAQSNWHGHRMYGHSGEQVVEELLPAAPPLWGVRAADAMRKFQHG